MRQTVTPQHGGTILDVREHMSVMLGTPRASCMILSRLACFTRSSSRHSPRCSHFQQLSLGAGLFIVDHSIRSRCIDSCEYGKMSLSRKVAMDKADDISSGNIVRAGRVHVSEISLCPSSQPGS